ncbi:DUF3169 family protein [Peptoniphilus indolicus]|uniref:DUF3169 domain-containing protein n=2 Tax=Peptoniphilus indolicus TaxID=33030 RepID=G4D202_9FIRM|nr:DUF3169 family protein [Peptoniphilus indolicus]EGY80433.1 hypothetical protein HMPREF9129_0432 [Peptoniphilus indolicus ATCC 29427]SUB75485.1 Protein of uncharacterised function (DUF3169) [Peptoniphilus indolicus]
MKSKFKSILILIGIGFIGGIFGFMSSRNSLGLLIYDFIIDLDKALYKNGFNALVISILSLSVAAWIFYFLGKAQVKRSLKNEEGYVKDFLLGISMVITACIAIFGIIFFANFMRSISEDYITNKIFGIALAVFIIGVLQTLVLNQLIVGFIKTYNPEKYENTLDIKFGKKYMDSLDEREQLEAYRAGFKTYKALTYIIFFLVLITGLVSMETNANVIPMFLFGILFAIGMIIYIYNVIDGEKHKK